MSSPCVQGDATDETSWRAALGTEKAQLLFTDPPYCLLTRRRKKGDLRDPKGKKNEGAEVRRFESVREYKEFTEGWLSIAVRHLGRDAPLIIWSNLLGRAPIASAATSVGYTLAGIFEWAKRTRESNSGEELLRLVEVASIFTRDGPRALGPADLSPIEAVITDHSEASQGPWQTHPNHKPARAIEPLMRAWSKPGDLIVDCFAGSGSIPAAALALGRRAACIELLPAWAERVTRRLERA